MGSLDGYSVLVTGGGSGIGLACARSLASEGAAVTICGRTAERLVAAADELRAIPEAGPVAWITADVTSESQVEESVARAIENGGGRLDGAVASAGGSRASGPLILQDVDSFRDTIDLNVTGMFLTVKHAGLAMAERGGGSIVGISSHAGRDTFRFLGAYGAAKAGLDMVVRVAADELGPANVRVNSVLPGIVATEIMAAITAGGPVLNSYMDNIPLRRIGQVDDVAALVRFLIGPESSWITGQNISVDGGQSLRKGADFSYFAEMQYGSDPRWRFVNG
jgi:NAD(P)-dependent dehydrogenase (short-subunit alcohol dehydrogenase family)